MKSILWMASMMLLSLQQFSQTPGQQQEVTMGNRTALVYLPADHNTSPSTTRYPTIFYFPGGGVHNSQQNLGEGIPLKIANGWNATQAMPCGITEKFIVVSLNESNGWVPDTETILNYTASHYKTDTTRWYGIGASEGSKTLISYLLNFSNSSTPHVVKRFKAGLILGSPWVNGTNNYSTLTPFRVRGYHGTAEGSMTPPAATSGIVDSVKKYNPSIASQSAYIPIQGGTHISYWNTAFASTSSDPATNAFIWFIDPNAGCPTQTNLAGYVTSRQGDPGAACGQSTTTAIYTANGKAGYQSIIYLNEALTTPLNGNWGHFGFNPANNSSSVKHLAIAGNGEVYDYNHCNSTWQAKIAAGYIHNTGQSTTTAACSLTTSTQIFTDDGTLSVGKIIYTTSTGDQFNGNGLYYGYSTTSGGAAVKSLEIGNGNVYASVNCSGGSVRNDQGSAEERALHSKEFRIYPNPASTTIKVEIPSTRNSVMNVQLVNISGQVEMEKQVRGMNHTFNIAGLKRGIYMVRILDQKNQPVLFRKVVVQ